MIRQATLEDIDDIINITKACAAHMIERHIYQWNAHYPNKKAFLKDIEHKELYTLSLEQGIIGCITISKMMDVEYEVISWLTPNDHNIYIHRLAIHPNYQGQGYAQQLMDYAENHAKINKCHSVRLDTFSQNPRNQKFYEQRGYQRLGNVYFPNQSTEPFYCYELPI
ncbi:GNAT family N-acetyltransferase [Psychroserpens sp. BH13MA-6]